MKKSYLLKIFTLTIIIIFIGMSFSHSIATMINKPTLLTFNRNIFYVGGSGSGNYTKIQDAIDNASDGDTVFVYDDSSPYTEYNISISKSITLKGEERKTTIIKGNEQDIFLINANNMSIYGFTIQNARYGIRLESSSGSIISNNIFTSNRIEGISIANSSNNTISDNIVRNNNYGIGLHWTLSAPGPCTYNTIMNNIITDNHYRGIEISLYHRYNKIIGNTISNNTKYGIKICCICNDNIIYHNNFKDNGQNAEDSYNNTWDNGYPTGGNYWDDYNGSDIDNDGIGDTPYDISGGNNQDAYPLMVPWNENQPPNKPIISGPIFGKVGVEYKWSFISTDPDMDDIYYQIKWCDINSSQELVGPYLSGEKISLNHSYTKNGQYTIYAKAIDIYDAESDWSDYNIIILKNKICHEFLLINLFEKLCFFQKIFSFFNKN